MPFVKEKFTLPNPLRAFVFLMREFNYTQAQAQRAIAKGRILVGGESIYGSSDLIHGEIEYVYFKPISRGNTPIFSTPDFMLFDKPSGVLVHPKKMTTPYSMLDEVRSFGGDNANGTHRIDMETSGLYLAAKNTKIESIFKVMFQERQIQKSYLAWVDGKFKEARTIEAPIKSLDDYSNIKHKVMISEEGKTAQTHFVPLEYDANLDATLVECFPHTGRTHQIRIHLFHVKHPIIGDPLYGTTFEVSEAYLEERLTDKDREIETGANRLLLHANTLQFIFKGNPYTLTSREEFRAKKELIVAKEKRKFNRLSS
ncbi:MAG: RluA family pseudouridine synthase [Campylobacterales bacterium]|nr:RluA family pseudouridine synthase [Campylobacterales bacterium]